MSAKKVACLLVALASALAGIALAVNHPLWPMGMLVLLIGVAVLEWAVPGAWLLLVPASLPFMNFAPWTGWATFEELDILVLAVLAGAYVRLAWVRDSEHRAPDIRKRRLLNALLLALALTGLASFLRGVMDAGGWAFDWFGGYAHAMNSLRVFKSLGFSLLLWPLLQQQQRANAQRTERLFALGMVLGLAWVSLVVLWERWVFVGLLDFSSNYRTVASFWEMHVGGAAIDAYLAIATPFALWALVSAKRPVVWMITALLTLLAGYACLTTFSRGVYLALGVELLLMALVLGRRSALLTRLWARWRLGGMLVVAALLMLEVVAVLGDEESFMNRRLASASQDTGYRLAHWKSGLGLLQTPFDWVVGKGLGRIPANYAGQVAGESFSGTVGLRSERGAEGAASRFVTLGVPDELDDLAGTYALTQRVDLQGKGAHVLQMDVRVQQPVELTALLCQRHLLYDRVCQGVRVPVKSQLGAWQSVQLSMRGPWLGTGRWPITFALSLDTAGATADVDNVQVLEGTGRKLLRNGDFSQGLAQWLPAAQSYFVPWHIDNLYLEVLIERGGLGFLSLGLLLAWALAGFLLAVMARTAVEMSVAAGLTGLLVVGLVSSVLDAPRVALLLYLLALLLLGKRTQQR